MFLQNFYENYEVNQNKLSGVLSKCDPIWENIYKVGNLFLRKSNLKLLGAENIDFEFYGNV